MAASQDRRRQGAVGTKRGGGQPEEDRAHEVGRYGSRCCCRIQCPLPSGTQASLAIYLLHSKCRSRPIGAKRALQTFLYSKEAPIAAPAPYGREVDILTLLFLRASQGLGLCCLYFLQCPENSSTVIKTTLLTTAVNMHFQHVKLVRGAFFPHLLFCLFCSIFVDKNVTIRKPLTTRRIHSEAGRCAIDTS